MAERRERGWKVEKFDPWQKRRENFLQLIKLSVLTYIQCPFNPPSSSHSANGAGGGSLQINTRTPLTTQRSWSGLTVFYRRSVESWSKESNW